MEDGGNRLRSRHVVQCPQGKVLAPMRRGSHVRSIPLDNDSIPFNRAGRKFVGGGRSARALRLGRDIVA